MKSCGNCKHAQINWYGFWFGSGSFRYLCECSVKNTCDMKSHDEIYEEIDCSEWKENKKDKTGFTYVSNVKMTKQEAANRIADICENNTGNTNCDECLFFYDNYDECIYKMLEMGCPKYWR